MGFLQRLVTWDDSPWSAKLHRSLGTLLMTVASGNYYRNKWVNPSGLLSALSDVGVDLISRGMHGKMAQKLIAEVLDLRFTVMRSESPQSGQHRLEWQSYRRTTSQALWGKPEGEEGPRRRGMLPMPVDTFVTSGVQRKMDLPMVEGLYDTFHPLLQFLETKECEMFKEELYDTYLAAGLGLGAQWEAAQALREIWPEGSEGKFVPSNGRAWLFHCILCCL